MVRGLQPGDPPVIGPYRLVGQLGCGGMGRVFLGLSAGGRPVAVKVIRAELAADQEFRVRFGREVTAARRVSGLFTALVIDADVDSPVPWLATAYVSGPSLTDAVARYGPMPAPSALALAAGLAEGLSAIHAAAVVHCDLKPSNVLLSRDGPRVIDFGISRAAEVISVTGASPVVGSPGFMSPEQAMGQEIGPPSDVFSLGAVLVFAATGQGPFGEGSGLELAYRLVYGEPNLDQVPAGLQPLIRHCLAKEPGERPTAGELLASVATLRPTTDWLPDAATGAFAGYLTPPPASSGRDQTPRRRWRRLAAAGAAASVLAASAAVSFALSGGLRHPPAARLQPKAATSSPAARASAPAALSPPGSSSGEVSSPSGFPGPAPAAILPAMRTRSSPGTSGRADAAPSAAKSSPAKPSPRRHQGRPD